MATTKRPACKAKTRAGKRCRNTAVLEDGYCVAHTPNTADPRRLEGGPKPGAGRPPNPRAVDVLRERLERDIERVLAPLFEALDADRGVVVGSGESACLEHLPDYAVRIAAVRELLDRAYGRPRQALEHTGPEGGPVKAEVDVGDPEVRGLIGELLRRRPAARD